ncbi:AMP-binding protein [Kitasatospora sp. NPDC047058]|uniref:AMP-binding protein n=1 Tax=Kitasatospora sp. NPDC047058 TaxID=3155620 RepID=UPI0033D2B5DC
MSPASTTAGTPTRTAAVRPVRPAGPEGPNAADHPDDPVVLHAVDSTGAGRAVTRHELAEQVERATTALARLGVRPGDRVALQLPLIPEAVVALLACTRIGAVATTLAPWAARHHDPADELARRRLRRVRLLVTTDDRGPAGSGDTALGSPPVLVVRTGSGPARRPEDRWSWWHRALAVPSPRHGLTAPAPEERAAGLRLGLRGPADVYWCAAGLDWLVRHPQAVAGPLALGAAQVICEDPARSARPEQLRETLQTYGVTVLHARPDSLHDVLWQSRAGGPHAPDLPGLHLVAPVPHPAEDPAPDHWYWQREPLPAPAWHLRHGPSPWSLPPAVTPTGSCPERSGMAARP